MAGCTYTLMERLRRLRLLERVGARRALGAVEATVAEARAASAGVAAPVETGRFGFRCPKSVMELCNKLKHRLKSCLSLEFSPFTTCVSLGGGGGGSRRKDQPKSTTGREDSQTKARQHAKAEPAHHPHIHSHIHSHSHTHASHPRTHAAPGEAYPGPQVPQLLRQCPRQLPRAPVERLARVVCSSCSPPAVASASSRCGACCDAWWSTSGFSLRCPFWGKGRGGGGGARKEACKAQPRTHTLPDRAPARQQLGYLCPLVPEALLSVVYYFFLCSRPWILADAWVKVVNPSDKHAAVVSTQVARCHRTVAPHATSQHHCHTPPPAHTPGATLFSVSADAWATVVQVLSDAGPSGCAQRANQLDDGSIFLFAPRPSAV